ncbi:MAG TPA: R3H domain-containing nucleic acid-binding protein [Polyangiaceae bacterium]
MSHPSDEIDVEKALEASEEEDFSDQGEGEDEEYADDADSDEADYDGNGNGNAESVENGAVNGARQRTRRRRPEGPEYTGDERAQQALRFVADLVREMEMDCRVDLRRPREESAQDEINIEISGKDSGRIIGKKGQVLQALQFLTHRVVNRPGQERRHILVDAEGYRNRRDNSLATMAQRLGKQAVEQGKIITFEPMNPRDRRVVHLALAKFEGVITKSDGEGDDRRVQIIPVRR